MIHGPEESMQEPPPKTLHSDKDPSKPRPKYGNGPQQWSVQIVIATDAFVEKSQGQKTGDW